MYQFQLHPFHSFIKALAVDAAAGTIPEALAVFGAISDNGDLVESASYGDIGGGVRSALSTMELHLVQYGIVSFAGDRNVTVKSPVGEGSAELSLAVALGTSHSLWMADIIQKLSRDSVIQEGVPGSADICKLLSQSSTKIRGWRDFNSSLNVETVHRDARGALLIGARLFMARVFYNCVLQRVFGFFKESMGEVQWGVGSGRGSVGRRLWRLQDQIRRGGCRDFQV